MYSCLSIPRVDSVFEAKCIGKPIVCTDSPILDPQAYPR